MGRREPSGTERRAKGFHCLGDSLLQESRAWWAVDGSLWDRNLRKGFCAGSVLIVMHCYHLKVVETGTRKFFLLFIVVYYY